MSKLKKTAKWTLIATGALVVLVVLALGGFFAYLNYEGKKSVEQKTSLKLLDNMIDSKTEPDVKTKAVDYSTIEVDFYDDLDNDEITTIEVELERHEYEEFDYEE